LISSIADLGLFGVQLTTTQKEIKHKLWPGPFSILLPIDQKRFAHITHTHSIAFRIPTDTWLRDFLTLSGPVIAPSANPTAQKPAESISEAQAYFGDGVDFYIDGGVRTGKASTLLEVDAGGNIQIHRMGPVDPYGLI